MAYVRQFALKLKMILNACFGKNIIQKKEIRQNTCFGIIYYFKIFLQEKEKFRILPSY